MEEIKDLIREKLNNYSKTNIEVHVKLKTDRFRNLFVNKIVSDDIWEIEERVLGRDLLFLDEIKEQENAVSKVEPLKSKGKLLTQVVNKKQLS